MAGDAILPCNQVLPVTTVVGNQGKDALKLRDSNAWFPARELEALGLGKCCHGRKWHRTPKKNVVDGMMRKFTASKGRRGRPR